MLKKIVLLLFFFDEINYFLNNDISNENYSIRKLKTEFLLQIKEIENNNKKIIILGTTHIPWELDSKIKLIFKKKIYIGLPNIDTRKSIIKLIFKNTENTLTEEQLNDIAIRTEGYSGSDIYIVINNAINGILKKYQNSSYFMKIIKNGKEYFTPCISSHSEAIKMKIDNIPNIEMIIFHKIEYNDLILSLKNVKSTISQEDLEK